MLVDFLQPFFSSLAGGNTGCFTFNDHAVPFVALQVRRAFVWTK
jgi:hypothetical protein